MSSGGRSWASSDRGGGWARSSDIRRVSSEFKDVPRLRSAYDGRSCRDRLVVGPVCRILQEWEAGFLASRDVVAEKSFCGRFQLQFRGNGVVLVLIA